MRNTTATINSFATEPNLSYTSESTSQTPDAPYTAGGNAAACPLPSKSVFEMSGDWSVVVTKTNYERRLSSELATAGIDHFLPLVETEHKTPQGRRVRTLSPLFPTYLFLCGDDSDRDAAYRSRSTIKIIQPPRPRKLFQELSQVERALHENRSAPVHTGLIVGKRCKVKDTHPLFGTEGTLERRDDGRARFVVTVEMLGRGIELEIGPEHLEPAD